MSQAATTPEMLRELYQPVAAELQQAEELLKRELRSRHVFVDQLVQHGFRLSGKRLRPALLLLAGKAVGSLNQDHLVLAAVVEMIHTATLVHDDVLDEAQVRRHTDTVNARYNNEASVLLGDYLFTHAFYLASTLESTWACRRIGQATNTVCEGELRQVHASGNLFVTEEEYVEIIEAKTAALCACCCALGARYAGADESQVERLQRYGRALGIAFQIADDLLDLEGDEARTGKTIGTDLAKRKATLPVIHALRTAEGEEREQLLLDIETNERPLGQIMRPWLERFESLPYAREQARGYALQAHAEIAGLPDSPPAAMLRSLTEFVVARDG